MSDYNALIDSLPDLTEEKRKRPLDDKLPDISKGPPSTTADVAKSAAWAPAKALAGLLGLPRDLADLTSGARAKLESYLPKAPDWLRDTDALLGKVTPTGLAKNLPGSGDIRSSAETFTGPWYDPQTRAGKVADTAVQTGLTMGRNLWTTPGKAAGLVAAITGGTEGAGALTNDNPAARFAGGLIGGAGPTIVNAARSQTGNVVRNALGNITPEQEARALQMQAQARAAGIPLLGTESLDAGHALASKILSSLGGGQQVTDFITKRPGQVRTAAERELLDVTGNRGTPNVNAARAQDAATKVIEGAEDARSAAVRPYYDAARRDVISPEAMQAVSNTIRDQRPSFPLPGQQSAFNRFANIVDPAPGMNATTADALYKGARAEAEIPVIGATPEQKQVAAAMGPVAASLKAATEESPNLTRGRALYQDITRNTVEPLTAGPVGKVAGKGFDPAVTPPVERVTSAVSNPANTRGNDVRSLYTHLNAQDPQAFPGIAKTWIENELNTALSDLRGGPPVTAGSKLRQALYGSPQQRENFDEVMRGVAQANGKDPDAVVEGARKLMEVLERTGRTPGMGSPTATRTEISRELGKSVTGDVMATVSGSPLRPWSERVDNWVNQSRHAQLADVLTAPNSVELLVKMAKLRPNGLTMRYYVASLLGLDRATASD